MRGVQADRRAQSVAIALLWLVTGAPSAGAFEYFDGRLQVHGYAEAQVRSLWEDFNASRDWDLAQWYNVINIEAEYDFAPDGWGPFDVLSSYVRVEARYDCVWTRACGIFPSANAFGNRATHLPRYKTDGHRGGFRGQVFDGSDIFSGPLIPRQNSAGYLSVRPEPFPDPRIPELSATDLPDNLTVAFLPTNNSRPGRIDQMPGFAGLFGVAGPNEIFEGGGDDPAYNVFSRQLRCKFGVRETPGGDNGIGYQIIGPINPLCTIDESGALRGKANPFNDQDPNPVFITYFGPDGQPGTPDDSVNVPVFGTGELPARAASEVPTTQNGDTTRSQGIFVPSPGWRRWRREKGFDDPYVDFRQAELEWNRGSSQDEKELKEAYLDMEFFDSRLWIRAGKQSIVWGKTELFRTTDQFNPQDLALASLPSLEESRISLWSVRGVWSFYDVGPVEDVRLELAFNFDEMEPADVGRCGEPFTALIACNKTTALWAHGLTGFALAGERRPDAPWQDFTEGIEFGGRLEFRYGRFSFQLSDFYGYEDLPYVKNIQTYERNIDPLTGRPRKNGSRGDCNTSYTASRQDPDCLPIQTNIASDGNLIPGATTVAVQSNRTNLLENYSGNAQLFAMICATSIGFNSLDPSACGQSVFNSLRNPLAGASAPPFPRDVAKNFLTISALLADSLAGNASAGSIIGFLAAATAPFVAGNVDPCDQFTTEGCPAKGQAPIADYGPHPNFGTSPAAVPNPASGTATLNQVLTDEQEALLGCGHFYGTDCEVDGFDLLNAEASALMQSWIGFEGDYSTRFTFNRTLGVPQPGTDGWVGPLPAGRHLDGRLVQLPGARGPFLRRNGTLVANPDYDPLVDGCSRNDVAGCAGTRNLVIPAEFGASAGQRFSSEMAAISFNLELIVAALSSAPDTSGTLAPDLPVEKDEFDFTNPFGAWDGRNPDDPLRGQCNWAQPQFCSSHASFFDITGVQKNTVLMGGDSAFGRRDFVWDSGAEGVLRYNRRNVLGFSTDFAEDVTKTNWGIEAAWIEGQRFTNNDNFSGNSNADTYNLTISVDRPTFINFLNSNRTFFMNSQWFFQYIRGYEKGFTGNGPYNILGTFTVQTGYFQDRLLPGVTFVYDRRSNSGAALPSITYRFTENLSGTVGANFFFGRWQLVDTAIAPLGTVGNETGRHAYKDAVETGLGVVRERDELFLRLRYTF